MAIYHFCAKLISRKSGRCAAAASAYRSGEKIHDNRSGLTFDYRRKSFITYKNIFTPPDMPIQEWCKNRQLLWNKVEEFENRKDAQLAREVEVALPIELSPEQQIKLVENFVKTQFSAHGMICDVSIHQKPNNPHCHILLTTRPILNDGFGQKNRDWNSKEQLEKWRAEWAKHCNRRLFVSGSKNHIDHRSFLRQGIKKIPMVHVPIGEHYMDKRGIPSTKIKLNIKTKENNMSNNKLNPIASLLKPQPELPTKLKSEYEVPDIRDGLVLSAMNFELHNKYRQSIFNQAYIAILRTILKGVSSGIDHIQTSHGECYRINLYGDGAVYDYGNQIKVQYGSDDEVKVAVMLAVEKGWNGIRLTGGEDFKQAVFLEAVINGNFNPEKIMGYIPSKEDIKRICVARPELGRLYDKTVIRSFLVEQIDSGSNGSQTQKHVPKLKF